MPGILQEIEVESCAGSKSYLKGDGGPRGRDDIMGDSISGQDMGHW